jgi:hypothetical protein
MRLVSWLLAMVIGSAALAIGSLAAGLFFAGGRPDLMVLLFVLVIVAVIGFCCSSALLIIWTWPK